MSVGASSAAWAQLPPSATSNSDCLGLLLTSKGTRAARFAAMRMKAATRATTAGWRLSTVFRPKRVCKDFSCRALVEANDHLCCVY